VICQTCGKEIADKAIVCYRCGAPTAIPEPARRTVEAAPGGRGLLAAIAVVFAAVLGWLVWQGAGPGQYAGWAGAFVAIEGLAWALRRRRGHRVD
jgi:hypothetical protein